MSRPTLRRTLLSSAVALACYGHSTRAFATCPTSTLTGTISACSVSGANSFTISATGVVLGDPAITFTTGATGNLNNAGAVGGSSSQTTAVLYQDDLVGTLNNSGTIQALNSSMAEAVAIYITDELSGNISNSGTIQARVSDTGTGTATAIYIGGDLSGTLTNTTSGVIQAFVTGSITDDAYAHGVYVGNDLTGTLTNQGMIHAKGSGSDDTFSAYGIYVGNDLSGSLINSGTIQATAEVTTSSSYAYAYGVYVGGSLTGSINNSGLIQAIARSSDSYPYAYGVYISGDLAASGQLTNSGTISAQATIGYTAEATGVYVGGDLAGNFLNTSSGVINAFATGSITDDAYAYGVYVGNDLTGTLTNQGMIHAKAGGSDDTFSAYGVYVDNELSGSLTNSGTIKATAVVTSDSSYAYAYGVYVGGALSGTLNNSGTISAVARIATETSYSATAYGIYVNGTLSGTLTNSGIISASATGGTSYNEAYGIHLDSALSGSLINSGTISGKAVNATESTVYAYGISIDGEVSGTLTNSGTIKATALAISSASSGAEAYGLYLGSTLSGTITNSGTISADVSAESGADVVAIGVDIGDLTGTFVNTGTIKVTVDATSSASVTALAFRVRGDSSAGTLTNSGTIMGDVQLNGGTLNLNGGVITGAITSSNPLDVNIGGEQLSSATNLTGANVDEFTVSSGGNWQLDANMADVGTFAVDTGGTVTFSGNDVNLTEDVTNAGAVATNAGVEATITGDYTQTSDGTLSTQVASSTSYGKLSVVGTATLPSNAKIDVDVTGSSIANGDDLQDILVATTLDSDGTFAVTDNSVLFDFSAALDGNTIDLTVEGGNDILETVQNASNNPAFGSALVLDQLVDAFRDGEDVGDFEAVINALGAITTEEELNEAVTQTLPIVSAGGGTALAGAAGRAANIIQSRVGGSGLSGGDGYFEDRHFWAKLHGSWIDQDDRKGISGYDGDAKGFVFGADGELASGTRLGAALSFARTDIDGNSAVAPQTTEVETWELTGYGSYRIDPQMSFDFQLALGHGNAEGARTIAFMPGSPVARSDYDSLSFRASGALSRAYAMGGNTEIVPSIRADYTLVKTDDYTETGAGALNLNVASDTTKAFIVGLDATVNHRANETTVLTANAGVGYDLLDEDASVTSSFAGGGAAFSTPGIDSERIVGRLGVGVNVQASEGLTFSARYDLEAREDFSNQTGSLRMRWKF